MDIKSFRYFNTVFEERNIREAAKILFISPQGLGKIIKTLEDEFDTTFFVRTKSGMIPTESAVAFYKWSKNFTDSMAIIHDKIKDIDNTHLSLRIAIANGTAKAFKMKTLMDIFSYDDQVLVQMFEYENRELIEKLISSKVDFGLTIGKIDDNRIEQELVMKLPLGILVYKGHRLYEKESIEISDLRNEGLISMNENFRIYHHLKDACLAEGFEPYIKLVAADGETLNRFCEEKLGLAFSPEFPELEIKDTKFVPFKNEGLTWDIYSTWLREKRDMTVIKAARKYFEENKL